MLNRNPKKSEEVIAAIKKELGKKADVSYITIDLGDQSSVKQAATEILGKVDRIDALMCNGELVHTPEMISGFRAKRCRRY